MGSLTFHQDVAPLLRTRCASCHQPGGPAPFSLTSYDEARQRAGLIAQVTARGLMPPWKASADSGPFVGQPRLSPADVDVIARWAADGALEGSPVGAATRDARTSGWQLGRPDMVVTPSAAFTLPADGPDVFRVFVLPVPNAVGRFVRGVEFRPGNARVVHHANLRVDATRASRLLDQADPRPGYEGLIPHSATFPDGHFLGWTPGQVAPLVPKGLAWRLESGSDLVVEVHMQPSGKSETVRPSVGLYFTSDAPARPPLMLRLGRQNIDIPPGDARYVVDDEFVTPVDVEVLAVQPHAHTRATRVRADSTLPDGTRRLLLEVPSWDFRWQHVYRFERPVTLPKGTRLSMQYVFDNSSANPRNPDVPPRRVTWGQRSSDEMGDVWLQLRTSTDADRARLVDAVRPKVLAEDAVGYERLLATGPESVALHDDVAQVYLNLGRAGEAVRHYVASVRLGPSSAPAHFNLGTALAVAGRLDESEAALREALRLRPNYSQAQNNLGGLLLQQGRAREALEHVRAAVRLAPENVEAHANLARTYATLGQFARAADAADAGLRLKPGEPAASALRAQAAAYRRRSDTR
jgi:Flp pilus assembly protein TadD